MTDKRYFMKPASLGKTEMSEAQARAIVADYRKAYPGLVTMFYPNTTIRLCPTCKGLPAVKSNSRYPGSLVGCPTCDIWIGGLRHENRALAAWNQYVNGIAPLPLLLTDQRSETQRWADEHRPLRAFYSTQLGEAYDPEARAFVTDPPWHQSVFDALKDPKVETIIPRGGTTGTRTGRWRAAEMPYLLPRTEHIVPKTDRRVRGYLEDYDLGDEIDLRQTRKPTFVPPEIDFGMIEARMVRAYQLKPFVTIEVNTSSFAAAMEKTQAGLMMFGAKLRDVMTQAQRWQDRAMLMAIYAGYEDAPNFSRERRIAKLLLSRDRRQRKRGERLFNQWRATRPGFNFTDRYRKD